MGSPKDGRPTEVREQVAKVLRRALDMAGSRHQLGLSLGVAPDLLDDWLDGVSDCPDEIVHKLTKMALGYPPAST
jgi:hypothetical protein